MTTTARRTVGPQYLGRITRVLITAAGDQETTIATNQHGIDGRDRQLTVLTGSVLTYCTSLAGVEAHAVAWTTALGIAERALPERARLYGLPETFRAAYNSQLSQTIHGDPSWDITKYAPSADPAKMASVWVRVGQLTVRVLDIYAAASIAATWTASLPVATALFHEPPEPLE